MINLDRRTSYSLCVHARKRLSEKFHQKSWTCAATNSSDRYRGDSGHDDCSRSDIILFVTPLHRIGKRPGVAAGPKPESGYPKTHPLPHPPRLVLYGRIPKTYPHGAYRIRRRIIMLLCRTCFCRNITT